MSLIQSARTSEKIFSENTDLVLQWVSMGKCLI